MEVQTLQSANNEKLKLETLVCSVGANLQAMIHIIVHGLRNAKNL